MTSRSPRLQNWEKIARAAGIRDGKNGKSPAVTWQGPLLLVYQEGKAVGAKNRARHALQAGYQDALLHKRMRCPARYAGIAEEYEKGHAHGVSRRKLDVP